MKHKQKADEVQRLDDWAKCDRQHVACACISPCANGSSARTANACPDRTKRCTRGKLFAFQCAQVSLLVNIRSHQGLKGTCLLLHSALPLGKVLHAPWLLKWKKFLLVQRRVSLGLSRASPRSGTLRKNPKKKKRDRTRNNIP